MSIIDKSIDTMNLMNSSTMVGHHLSSVPTVILLCGNILPGVTLESPDAPLFPKSPAPVMLATTATLSAQQHQSYHRFLIALPGHSSTGHWRRMAWQNRAHPFFTLNTSKEMMANYIFLSSKSSSSTKSSSRCSEGGNPDDEL